MTSSHRMSGTQQYQLQEIKNIFVNCSFVTARQCSACTSLYSFSLTLVHRGPHCGFCWLFFNQCLSAETCQSGTCLTESCHLFHHDTYSNVCCKSCNILPVLSYEVFMPFLIHPFYLTKLFILAYPCCVLLSFLIPRFFQDEIHFCFTRLS